MVGWQVEVKVYYYERTLRVVALPSEQPTTADGVVVVAVVVVVVVVLLRLKRG